MKKVIYVLASALFCLHAEAQYSNKQSVADFNAIEVGSAAKVTLVQSDSNYIVLTSKAPMDKMHNIEVEDGVLKVTSPEGGNIEVHVKNLTSIKVSDGAKVECADTLKADNLRVHVSDAAGADIWVNAKSIKARANDAGNITFSGSTDSLTIRVSDASHANTTYLRADNVTVVTSDGSNAEVLALKSIDADATDGSTIRVKGNPIQKNNNATDGGSVKTYNSAEVMPHKGAFNIIQKDTNADGKAVQTYKGDGFIGFGFVTGGSNGLNIRYGRSREFIVGFGNAYPIAKYDLIGVDVYYKSSDFYLAKSSFITSDSNTHYQAQKISLQNFGGLLYDRVLLGKKSFIDAGIYGDWTFYSKLVSWDNSNQEVSDTKTILTNLSYVNSGNYGFTIRYMPTLGVMFYFNYRLSPALQNIFAGDQETKLPNGVVGVTFGF